MQNSKLKNIFISAAVAVFAGVLVLGVNAAFGVSAPTVSPEGSGLVGPTFSEMTTTGDAEINGSLKDTVDSIINVTGAILASGNITTTSGALWTDDGNIGTTKGSIYARRPAGSTDDTEGNVIAYNNLQVGADTDGGSISAGAANDSNNDVKINDVLNITRYEDANDSGNGSLRINYSDGTRYLTMDNNEIITHGDNFNINYEGTGNTVIGSVDDRSNLNVNGNINTIGYIANPTVGTPTQPIWINDPLYVSEDITFDTYASGPNIYVNDIISRGALTLYLNKTNKEGVEIGSSGNTSSLTVYGAVRADRFGIYGKDTSSPISISAGSTAAGSMACPSGETVISCGIYSANSNTLVRYLYPGDTGNNSCYGAMRNNSSSATTFRIDAYCLDPDE